jgi:hypothetical protein
VKIEKGTVVKQINKWSEDIAYRVIETVESLLDNEADKELFDSKIRELLWKVAAGSAMEGAVIMRAKCAKLGAYYVSSDEMSKVCEERILNIGEEVAE